MKRRKLTDLYVVGKVVSLDDGTGEPYEVYLRKLNQIEQEDALRRANAARARILAQRKHPDSTTFLSSYNEVLEFDLDVIITTLSREELQKEEAAIAAEVAFEEKWSKDGYLQGVLDALQAAGADADPEDPEIASLLAAQAEFEADVAAARDARYEDIKAAYVDRSEEKLRELMTERMVQFEADVAWLQEMRRCEVWYATRDIRDKVSREFATREEVDQLQSEVIEFLANAYREMLVEVTEGKGSGAIPASSPSPVQPETEVMAEDSGQLVAIA